MRDSPGGADDGLMAHAWVELDDEVVMGDREDLDEYRHLGELPDGATLH